MQGDIALAWKDVGPDYEPNDPRRQQVVELWHRKKESQYKAKQQMSLAKAVTDAQLVAHRERNKLEAEKKFEVWKADKAARKRAEQEHANAQQLELEMLLVAQEARQSVLSMQLQRHRGCVRLFFFSSVFVLSCY